MGRLRKLITSTIVAVVFCAAIVMLYRQLQHYSYQDIVQSLRSIPTGKLLLAVALTGVNYLVLGVYDLLALRAIGRPMPLRQVALAAIVGYAASFNFGALLGGSAVRYRFYSAWGLSTADILHLLAMIGVVFWIGMFALAGTVFVITPVEAPPDLNLPFTSTRPLGTVLLTIAVAYLAATAIRREPVKIRNWEVSLPSPGLSAAQLAVASADLLVAAAILFVLLPVGVSAGYGSFIGIYLLAVTAVVLTHVPGGVGVFELVVLTMLDPDHPDQVMGSLIAFRFIYYLLPLGIAGGLLGSFELTQGRSLMKRLSAASERLSPALVPRVMAILTLIGGGVLLLANAVPVIPARLDWLGARVPLLVIEAAHVIGSFAGVVLLLMGYSLQRRSLGGYWLAVTLLAIGILSCLVRGLDIEEASILLALLLALIPTRRYFMRPGVLLSDLPRPAWLVAVSLVLLTVTTLGAFVHRRVVYSSGLWWQFGIDAEASRFLRMTLGTSLVVAAVAVARFLRQPRIVMALPTDSQVRDAAAVMRQSTQSQVTPAQLPGKHLILDEQRRAVILFDAGPTNWIALGDPIGDVIAGREVAWRFSDLADRAGRTPAFYDVGGDHASLYLEIGLALLPLGELARVKLPDFSLDGPARRELRHAWHRLQHEHCSFAVLEGDAADAQLAELRRDPQFWTTDKHASPRRWIGLGWADESWAGRPLAVVRRGGETIAAGSIWCGDQNSELTVEALRPRQGAPDGVLEYLLVEVALWGQKRGFEWFELGSAPHGPVDEHALAPLWERVGPSLYRHGEHFATFAALRQFKERFDPLWTSRYLASPADTGLNDVLIRIAELLVTREVASRS